MSFIMMMMNKNAILHLLKLVKNSIATWNYLCYNRERNILFNQRYFGVVSLMTVCPSIYSFELKAYQLPSNLKKTFGCLLYRAFLFFRVPYPRGGTAPYY